MVNVGNLGVGVKRLGLGVLKPSTPPWEPPTSIGDPEEAHDTSDIISRPSPVKSRGRYLALPDQRDIARPLFTASACPSRHVHRDSGLSCGVIPHRGAVARYVWPV